MYSFNVNLFYNFASFPKKGGLNMKPSKSAQLNYRLGVVFFAFSAIAFVLSSIFLETEYFLLTLGFFALCLFWIMGIQRDLYRKEAKK